MRILAFATALCAATPSLADTCGSFPEEVSSATGVEAGEREPDFVSYTADPETTVTLVCHSRSQASVGAYHRGEEPPDSFFRLFGQAGQVVTGIAADRLSSAAQRARANAPKLKHSNVVTNGVLVTCTFSRSKAGQALTMCAAVVEPKRI